MSSLTPSASLSASASSAEYFMTMSKDEYPLMQAEASSTARTSTSMKTPEGSFDADNPPPMTPEMTLHQISDGDDIPLWTPLIPDDLDSSNSQTSDMSPDSGILLPAVLSDAYHTPTSTSASTDGMLTKTEFSNHDVRASPHLPVDSYAAVSPSTSPSTADTDDDENEHENEIVVEKAPSQLHLKPPEQTMRQTPSWTWSLVFKLNAVSSSCQLPLSMLLIDMFVQTLLMDVCNVREKVIVAHSIVGVPRDQIGPIVSRVAVHH